MSRFSQVRLQKIGTALQIEGRMQIDQLELWWAECQQCQSELPLLKKSIASSRRLASFFHYFGLLELAAIMKDTAGLLEQNLVLTDPTGNSLQKQVSENLLSVKKKLMSLPV